MPSSGPAPTSRRVSVSLTAERRGDRLDRVLADLLPEYSRSALQRLLREGRVTLGDDVARASYKVRGGERIVIDIPEPRPSAIAAEDRPLAILHEDKDLLVLDKPPGVTVHPGAGASAGTLVNALLHHCRGLSTIGGEERPGIVHRLDRDTSGVLVVVKNDLAHRSLAAQFKARSVRKIYEALVWGRPRVEKGVIDAPLGRHPTARVKMAVRRDGRAAKTGYQVLESLGPVALLELRPETGRTHQLRVHLQSIGHSIVGDRVYGGDRSPALVDRRFREALSSYAGLALHARRLGFTHPGTGEWREFEAPRPGALEDLIGGLRLVVSKPGAPGGGGR